ncbi:MAG: acyl-CoA dehydratase activase-related protein [Coriobacteriia bacterium]
MATKLRLGIDIGSKTLKVVVLGESGRALSSFYESHRAEIHETLVIGLRRAILRLGDAEVSVRMTGSGAMRLARQMGIPFVQEVVAAKKAIDVLVPEADVVVELGGEDAKIIYLRDGLEQRMNSSCAGGTGAFIDHMAALLGTNASGLGNLALGSLNLYPIASRCGVFAQSDIRPLVDEGASMRDIANSILQSVVTQILSGLACGRPIRGKVALIGGPFHFLPALVLRFWKTLGLRRSQVLTPSDSHLFSAIGAALSTEEGEAALSLSELLARVEAVEREPSEEARYLPPLFETEADLEAFRQRHSAERVAYNRAGMSGEVYLGIDVGSTTAKIALINAEGELLHSGYRSSRGDLIGILSELLDDLYATIGRERDKVRIGHTTVTGYGEGLVLAGFRADSGEVETVAHLRAARQIVPDVDSVLDIGGQDMKYLRVRNGAIDSVALNEACSSGCGSFIEGFSYALRLRRELFSKAAFGAEHPVDLGSRCTVFMTSRVKQAQREGARPDEIAAGLAYSVVKNALYKVIKLRDPSELGKKVVVQGGTFLNDAVLRAFELVSGREVVRPSIAGIMGAYGAALIARERADGSGTRLLRREELRDLAPKQRSLRCGGCANACLLAITDFGVDPETGRQRRYVTGNRCEKGAGISLIGAPKVPDLVAEKYRLLFGREPLPEAEAPRGTVGIPRALNMYDNYVFWHRFFGELGYRVVLSAESSRAVYEAATESVPSESACYPAKLAHGHIRDLIGKGVDFIFMPCIKREGYKWAAGGERAVDRPAFSCPVIASYPEALRLNIGELRDGSVEFLAPYLPYHDRKLLAGRLYAELVEKRPEKWPLAEVGGGVRRARMARTAPTCEEVARAADRAWTEDLTFRKTLRVRGEEALAWAEEHGAHAIILAAHPYHIDPEISHRLHEMIASFGVVVLTEDSVGHLAPDDAGLAGDANINTSPVPRGEREYHRRLFSAARFAASRDDVDFVQLTSFGCGTDATVNDEIRAVLESAGKIATLFKVDEMSSLGTMRIRIRSLIAAIEARAAMREVSGKAPEALVVPAPPTPPAADKTAHPLATIQQPGSVPLPDLTRSTILCPQLSPLHFELASALLRAQGYDIRILPTIDSAARQAGVAHAPSDICYPLSLQAGQIMHAVSSGDYDVDRLAVLVPDTGGPCVTSDCGRIVRKMLADAGYGQVPVISLSVEALGSAKSPLPGSLSVGSPSAATSRRLARQLAMAAVLGDLLMQCALRKRPYEAEQGSADALFESWLCRCAEALPAMRLPMFRQTVTEIVGDFDRLPLVEDGSKPLVGVVGSPYLRFNPNANNGLIGLLEAEGCEVSVPPLTDTVLYALTSAENDLEIGASRREARRQRSLSALLGTYREIWERAAAESQRLRAPATVTSLLEKARTVVSPSTSAGEGWLLVGEMMDLLERGAAGIVCVEALACLPNHIVGKGVARELRRRYPNANIATIDYDANASEMNQLNRLRLLVAVASSPDEALQEPAESDTGCSAC